MTDPIDFTARERFHIDVQRDPSALFWKSVLRSLLYIVPSLGLVVFAVIKRDYGYGLVGYGILLLQQAQRLVLVRRGLRTQSSILAKYESRTRGEGTKA